MGLSKGTKITYVEAKNGGLWVSHKRTDEDGVVTWENEKFKELTGILTKVWKYAKVYDNKPSQKVYIEVKDGEDTYRVYWTEKSSFTYGFGAQILNVDLNKPFTIQAWNTKKDSKATYCSLYQGTGGEGGKVELDPNFPKVEYTEKRGEVVVSHDAMLDAWDSVFAKLEARFGKHEDTQPKTEPKLTVEDIEEIPF